MATTQSQNDDRPVVNIINGRKVSSKEEAAAFLTGVLMGSCSNGEAYVKDPVLYHPDEVFTKQRLYVAEPRLAAVNAIVGPMGSGKTNLFNIFIDHYDDNNMILNDPKGEYVTHAHDASRDIIVGYPDSRAAVWDVIGEIKADRGTSDIIWLNMLTSISGKDSQNKQFDVYAVKILNRLISLVIASGYSREDYSDAIASAYKTVAGEVSGDEMQQSALGVAWPVISMLFQSYMIGYNDSRNFFLVDDLLTKYRRVFLLNNTNFADVLEMHNNALVAKIAASLLGRTNVKNGDLKNYVFLMLDEYLTFNLDVKLESRLFTLCRSKGISIFLGMQTLPHWDEEKMARIMTSRYLFCMFRTGDEKGAEAASVVTGKLKYQRGEAQFSSSGSGAMEFLKNPVSMSERWTDVEENTVPKDLIMRLPPYVCMVEMYDKDNTDTHLLTTFCMPALVEIEETEPEFIYSDEARNAVKLEEVL